jgi:hypothetical protein
VSVGRAGHPLVPDVTDWLLKSNEEEMQEGGRSDDRRVTSASTLMFRASNYNTTSLHFTSRLIPWCTILVLYLCCPVAILKPSSHWNRLPSPRDGPSPTINSHMKWATGNPERRYTYSYTQKARDGGPRPRPCHALIDLESKEPRSSPPVSMGLQISPCRFGPTSPWPRLKPQIA